MLIGYARTSTHDQNAGLAAQQQALTEAGCEKIFAEQVSSVASRDVLKAALAFLREGDTLVVTKPDRLARSTTDLLAIEADLAKRGVGLVIQSMGLDTRGNGSNPTTRLQLTILAAVAQFEREVMLERQRDGIAAAKAKGLTKAESRLRARRLIRSCFGGRRNVERADRAATRCQSPVGLPHSRGSRRRSL